MQPLSGTEYGGMLSDVLRRKVPVRVQASDVVGVSLVVRRNVPSLANASAVEMASVHERMMVVSGGGWTYRRGGWGCGGWRNRPMAYAVKAVTSSGSNPTFWPPDWIS